MALIEIKHRYTGAVLFALECGSLKICLTAAVKGGADLYGANLRSANLGGANLRSANLGKHQVLQIGPLGSRKDYLVVSSDAEIGIRFTAGCFSGTEYQFKEAIQKTHGDNDYAKQYRAAIDLALMIVKPAKIEKDAA